MPRWPRMVVPGVAVHVIQRGNNRQPIFFATDDYARFRADLVIYSLLGFASSPQPTRSGQAHPNNPIGFRVSGTTI